MTKEWAQAASAFQRATELRQSFPEAWNELGYALRHMNRYPDSVAAYEQALPLYQRAGSVPRSRA